MRDITTISSGSLNLWNLSDTALGSQKCKGRVFDMQPVLKERALRASSTSLIRKARKT